MRIRQHYALPPDTLFHAAQVALAAMHPIRVDVQPAARRIDAVFRVIFFKDDVALVVTPQAEGAALHFRSASRVGQHDLGVNRRRMERFLAHLERRL